jgi:hypothetical protein
VLLVAIVPALFGLFKRKIKLLSITWPHLKYIVCKNQKEFEKQIKLLCLK